MAGVPWLPSDALLQSFKWVSTGMHVKIGEGFNLTLDFAALLHIIPESPRYLLRKNRSEEAVQVVRKIYPYATEKQVQLKVGVMESNVAAIRKVEESLTVAQRLRRIFRNGPSRRALIIACGLQAFQQLSGFNSLMYFSSSLFEQVGFQNSTAVSLIVAGTNCVFTIIAFMIIEYVPPASCARPA